MTSGKKDWISDAEREEMRRGIGRHDFKNPDGYYSASCTAMVLRKGSGEDCGLPSDDVMHGGSVGPLSWPGADPTSRMVPKSEPVITVTPTFVPLRSDILDEADSIINGDRQATYGDATSSFQRIANLWTAYRSIEPPLTANEAAMMLALLKVSRAASSPGHRDSYVDLAGYAALAGEIGIEKEKDA